MNKKLIYFIVIFTLLFSITSIASSQKVWKDRPKELFFPNFSKYVRDCELNQNNNYEKLRIFFNNCSTPEDFYNRIQENIVDAYEDADPDISEFQRHLTDIVNEITDNNASLNCQHQSILFIAGVKAVFSDYDAELQRYVLNNSYGNFKIEIWRSLGITIFSLRSHTQVIIDKWNGTDMFQIDDKTVDKIELDTWSNQLKEFNKKDECVFYPFLPAKINSVLFTD